MRINERTWQVTFAGNGFTSREGAKRGALRRAAELTRASGFYGYWIAEQDSSVDVSSYATPVDCMSNGHVENSGYYANGHVENSGHYTGQTNCSGGDTRMVRRPSTSITINMVTYPEARQAPPNITIYDAVMILQQP
jgi:hypothetical protein